MQSDGNVLQPVSILMVRMNSYYKMVCMEFSFTSHSVRIAAERWISKKKTKKKRTMFSFVFRANTGDTYCFNGSQCYIAESSRDSVAVATLKKWKCNYRSNTSVLYYLWNSTPLSLCGECVFRNDKSAASLLLITLRWSALLTLDIVSVFLFFSFLLLLFEDEFVYLYFSLGINFSLNRLCYRWQWICLLLTLD